MRVKQSRTRSSKTTPAPISDRKRSRRWASRGARGRQPSLAQVGKPNPNQLGPIQWGSILAVLLISAALISLIWTLTARAIEDETADIMGRTEKQVSSIAFVLARQVQREMSLVDQSLSILQESWKGDPADIDLAAWRKKSLALTAVANDIFIANERGIIVQGTIPQSVGQGFGSAYVTYPNGSMELFDASGDKLAAGRASVVTVDGTKIEARQFLMYVVRPLNQPPGFIVGASYRSETITQLFAGANLGHGGVVSLLDLKRGFVQAIVGSSARNAELDLSRSDLMQQMRKNDSGLWTGATPTDKVTRIIAYQKVPDRAMAVMVGISLDLSNEALNGLVNWARGLAVLGSLVVAVIAGILVWGIATAKAAASRERARESAEMGLANARQELEVAFARSCLNAIEAGTLISSRVDGVARIDEALRLRQWNQRFADLSGVPLDDSSRGALVEDFLRYQAKAGVFGDAEKAEHGLAARITVFHTGGHAIAPLVQNGPDGQEVTMLVRPVIDGGYMMILAGPENVAFATPPPLEAEPETESV